jgi:hypothetical protein
MAPKAPTHCIIQSPVQNENLPKIVLNQSSNDDLLKNNTIDNKNRVVIGASNTPYTILDKPPARPPRPPLKPKTLNNTSSNDEKSNLCSPPSLTSGASKSKIEPPKINHFLSPIQNHSNTSFYNNSASYKTPDQSIAINDFSSPICSFVHEQNSSDKLRLDDLNSRSVLLKSIENFKGCLKPVTNPTKSADLKKTPVVNSTNSGAKLMTELIKALESMRPYLSEDFCFQNVSNI